MRSMIVSSAGPFPSPNQNPRQSHSFNQPLYPSPNRVFTTSIPYNHATSLLKRVSSSTLLATKPSFFNINNNSIPLPDPIVDQVNQAIQHSWSKSTINRYSGAIRQFIRFCASLNVPQSLRFPADEFVLCAFAASSAGKHA